jgi:opacity protein-like surface antigen
MKRFALVLVFAAVLMPGRAEADGWVAPFFGVNFDGSTPADTKPKTYGISMGSMGGGIFGFETELSVSPDFFGESDDVLLGDNNVLTWMGNVLVGVPVGGQSGFGVRPFFTGGVGLIRRRVETAGELLEISSNDFAYNLGGGVMVFFGNRIGIRGDYRYYRNFSTSDLGLDFLGEEADEFSFSRLSGALIIRF